MKKIYLDHAAATPLDPKVLAAMEPYFSKRFYNPSALYLEAKAVAHDIAASRARIAKWLGARPGEIIFTAGGTEANNLAIRGVMEAHPKTNIIVSSIEHESVHSPARRYDFREAPVDDKGVLNLSSLEKMIDDHTVLISIIYANNEIGTVQSINQVSALVSEVRKKRQKTGSNIPLYLHTDACQAAAYLDLHTARLGVDLMTLNAGKIYGPKQCGVLFIRAGTKLAPQVLGGGQEQNFRSGTENVPAIIGMAEALDLVQKRRGEEIKRLQALQKKFIDEIREQIPSARVNGSLSHRLPNNVHITLPGKDNERLVMALDEAGVQCASGSACSASSDEPSHVLKAIGLPDDEAHSSLRFSMGRQSDETEISRTVQVLAKLVQ